MSSVSALTRTALVTAFCFAGSGVTLAEGKMVSVPSGTFNMGCDPGKDPVCYFAPDEAMHEVTLDAFMIDKFEVTFQRYQTCVDAGRCAPPAVGGALNYGWPGVESFPVNGVTWYQAHTFCQWEGKRLPTEAEWEMAARGFDGRIYPWGDEAPNCQRAVMDRPDAGHLGCGTGNTMAVGSVPAGASPFGAQDMAGNLWEWVADWHSPSYYQQSPRSNPKGPESGAYKVARGGDFFSRQGYEVRATSRFFYEPSDYSIAIGFRCAR